MEREPELIGQDKHLQLFRLETEPFSTNAYIVICRASGDSILIDAPGDTEIITEKLKDTTVKYILLTHGDGDHIMVLEELVEALGSPVAVHSGDAGMLPVVPECLLRGGNTLECGKLSLEVIHVPGHTPGSLCFKLGNYLIAGDVLFPGGPGKTKTPLDFKLLVASIKDQLLPLPDETVVLPGHGDSTTIGRERKLIDAFFLSDISEDLCGDVTWEES